MLINPLFCRFLLVFRGRADKAEDKGRAKSPISGQLASPLLPQHDDGNGDGLNADNHTIQAGGGMIVEFIRYDQLECTETSDDRQTAALEDG